MNGSTAAKFLQYTKPAWVVLCTLCGFVIGSAEGCAVNGSVGALPGATAGSIGAFAGTISCALILSRYSNVIDFWYLLPGALLGTECSEFGRPDISAIAGLLGGLFIGIVDLYVIHLLEREKQNKEHSKNSFGDDL